MGFFKNIIADSRQPVRTAGVGESFAVGAQSTSDLSSPAAADAAIGPDLGTAHQPVIQRAVKKAGTAGSKHSTAVAPQTQSTTIGTAQRNPSSATVGPAGFEQSSPQHSTVFPGVESAGFAESDNVAETVSVQSPINRNPGSRDAPDVSVSNAIVTDNRDGAAQQSGSDAGGDDNVVPSTFEAVGGGEKTTVEAAAIRRKSTTTDGIHSQVVHTAKTARRTMARGLVNEPSAAVVADGTNDSGKVYPATDIAPGAPPTPGGHSRSTAVESAGGIFQPPGHQGTLPASSPPTEVPDSAWEATRVHQAEMKQRSVNAPSLPARIISAVEKERQAAPRNVARPPQVRIGQVNVIVEAPAAPQRQSQPATADDFSSRLFLRSL